MLHYAAGLIPDVTTNPQDIDDAMKLGFNWQRGPFEMIDAIGSERFAALCDECGLSVPDILADGSPTYSVSQRQLLVRHAGGGAIRSICPTASCAFP